MKTTIISILGLLFTAGFCVAQDDLPANYGDGWYMATNSTTANETDFFPEISNPPVTGGTSAIAEAITPDISALARSLMNDPTRIYNYVHDHIRYVHYFGAHKGAEMTLLESSGNDFDQCALLVALLRAASFSPSYMFGMVSFPYATNTLLDYQHWVGTTLPNTNWGSIKTNVQVINGNVGYPYFTYTGNTNALYFHHIWVQLTLNGTNYTLDPAFKVNIPVAGINLDVAGQISTNNLLTDAAGTATADYVQNLNEGAIRADLGTYAANLLHFIQTNNPNASVQQIAGGSTVVPSTGLNQPVAFTVQTGSGNWPTSQWQYIPTNLMAVLIVTLPGTTSTTNSFYVPGLQGSRLSLVCTSSGQAQLYQEDTQLTNVQTTGSGSTFYPTLTFQHPFGTWNFASSNGLARSSWADQTLTNAAYQRTNATYVLLYGFDANTAWLTSRQRQLDLYRQQGNSDTSPQVTQETLNVMGLSWLAQTEPAVQLIARQDSILYHFLHRLGRMGQESGHGYFIDVYGQGVAVSPLDTASLSVTFNQNQVFQTTAYLESAFEYALIEQWQSSGLVAASTTKLLELASTNGQKIYLASSSNWTAGAYVSTNISNYSSSLGLGSYISAGYSLLLPQNGSIQIAGTNSWAGSGFVAYYNVSGNETIAMSITPGVNGGYASGLSSSPSASTVAGLYQVEPNYYTLQSATISCPTQPKGDPVNMVDGSFQISAADLSLGQTEPRGLNLTRYYSSARRNSNPAGMAPGWLHSYYCTAAPTSNPQAGLGGTTPQQMAPLLVAVRAMLDIYNSGQPDPKAWTVTALIADWGVDQLSNNSVSVTLGNDAVQFVKQPDGSYTPQANCTMSLIQTNGAYWLQERHGRTFKFGTNTLLTNIVDQYGQSLNVTYTTSNWVHTVTDWTNRTLTFNYTGPNLASVSDGTRTVSYGYTGGDLTSFTDADGNIFTYQYDTNHQVIATLDALNRLVVTNNYDINGHITTQLTQGATNKLWQVFAGGWQTAEIDPMGGQQNYFFDDQSRQTAFQDALGNLTQTVYDGQDHVITNISPLNEVTQFFYDGNNNLTETIDPLGFSNVFTFDSNNNLIASTDARTNTSHFGYNAQFSLIGQTNGNGDWTVLSFHSNGTLASRQDSAGTTTYGYDTNGTLASISYPSPLGSESFVNNALGDPTSHTDGNGNQTTFAYNNRRQLTNTIAPTNLTTKITYDANANLSTTTDARGFSTSNTWSVTRHLLATTFPITPQGTPVITNTYDARDWLAETQNPLGKPTYYTNDAAHRQIAVTDPLQRTTRFAYQPVKKLKNTVYLTEQF